MMPELRRSTFKVQYSMFSFSFMNDLKFAIRQLLKNPGFTAVAVLTLGAANGRDYAIVCVMPPGFQFPDRCELWLSAGWNGVPRDRRGGHWLSVIARLNPGVTLSQARTEMNTIQKRLERQYRDAFIGSDVAVVPLL